MYVQSSLPPRGCVGRLHPVPAEVGGDGEKSQLEAQRDLEVTGTAG